MSTDVSKLKVPDLREELKKRGLDTKGTKAVLLQRLLDSFISRDEKDTLEECDFIIESNGEVGTIDKNVNDQNEKVTIITNNDPEKESNISVQINCKNIGDDTSEMVKKEMILVSERIIDNAISENVENLELLDTVKVELNYKTKSESVEKFDTVHGNGKDINDISEKQNLIEADDKEGGINKDNNDQNKNLNQIVSNQQEERTNTTDIQIYKETSDVIEKDNDTILKSAITITNVYDNKVENLKRLDSEPLSNEHNSSNICQLEMINKIDSTPYEIVDLVNEEREKMNDDIKDRQSRKSRSGSKERKRSKSLDRKKYRSKSRSRSKSRNRSRDRKRSRSRDRKWAKYRKRSRSRSRDRKRSRSRDRRRTRSRSRSRNRKRSKSHDRKRSRSYDRKRSRSRSKNRTINKTNSNEQSGSKRKESKERNNSLERCESKEKLDCEIESKTLEDAKTIKELSKSKSRSSSRGRKRYRSKSRSRSTSHRRSRSRSRGRKRSKSRSRSDSRRRNKRSNSRRRSRSRNRHKSRSPKRNRNKFEKSGYKTTPEPERKMESDMWIQDTNVRADQYTMDMYMEVSDDGKICTPTTDYAFGYMWAGVRATYGISFGKICYQVKFLNALNLSHLPEADQDPHILRVGFSTENTALQLGEEMNSFGYESTANSVTANTFAEYGEKYSIDDVVTAYLDMSTDIHSMSFSKNGAEPVLCLIVGAMSLGRIPLFPHVLSKNVKFQLIFTSEEAIYPVEAGYSFIGDLDRNSRTRSRMPPLNKRDCQVLLMCGLPASGKTTWIANYLNENRSKNFNVIGTSAIIDRMRVMGKSRKDNYKGRWDLLVDYATKCLRRLLDIAPYKKRNYIIDQTNVYAAAQRRKMRPFEGFTRKAVVIIPPDFIYNERRKLQNISEGRQLTESAVLEMKANFRLPEVTDDYFDEVVFIESTELEAVKLVNDYNEEGRLVIEARRRRNNTDRFSATNRLNDRPMQRDRNDRSFDRRDMREGELTWKKPEGRPGQQPHLPNIKNDFRAQHWNPNFGMIPSGNVDQRAQFQPRLPSLNFPAANWRPAPVVQNSNWTPLVSTVNVPSKFSTNIAKQTHPVTTVQSTWTPLGASQAWQPLTMTSSSASPAPWLNKAQTTVATPTLSKATSFPMPTMVNAADMTTFMANMLAMNMNNPMAAINAFNAFNSAINMNNQAVMGLNNQAALAMNNQIAFTNQATMGMNNQTALGMTNQAALNMNNQTMMGMNNLAGMNSFMGLNPATAMNMMNQALNATGTVPPSQDQLAWNYNQFMMQLNQQMQTQQKQ